MSKSHKKTCEHVLKSHNWKIISKIDEGNYSKVLLVSPLKENDPEKYMACKIIDCQKSPEQFVKKFLPRELDIVLKLKHKHIILTNKIIASDHKYFMIMPYAKNGNLLKFIHQHGRLSENLTNLWSRQLASALKYLHEKNYAHRDLKCENVLITGNYNVKLADFGFARYCKDQYNRNILSTTYCGSLSFAAPEVIGGVPYQPKCADMWSFGVLIYVMLNNLMPYGDSNIKILYNAQIRNQWRFHPSVQSEISYNCKTVISNLLQPDVRRRWNVNDVLLSEWFVEKTHHCSKKNESIIKMANSFEERSKKSISKSSEF